MRYGLIALLLNVATHAVAQAPRVQRDVVYAAAEADRPTSTLDVYAPAVGDNHPVVLWIHGGGWRHGDKTHVQEKPRALNERGFALVSVNYRLHPDATYKQQASDITQAVRWVRDHAREFGGSSDGIFVMGHSAGAHLAALVATDSRYLAARQMTPGDLRGVVLLDGAGYDIPRQIEQARLPRAKELYLTVFGNDVATQRDASPITHIAKSQGIPPFLILHVAERRDSRLQSEALAERLNSVGTPAKVVAAQEKTHATINREFGAEGDAVTAEVLEFLNQRSRPHDP